MSPFAVSHLYDRLERSVLYAEEAEDRDFSYYMQERYPSGNGVTSLPFSDHHNPHELPRLPSPNHGDVACWGASVSILLDIGGARLIRDLGGGIVLLTDNS